MILIPTVVVILGMCYMLKTKEGFWDIPARTWKVDRVFQLPGSPDFMQTPHFQGILSPRFSNVDYGPYLRTQLPGYDTTGVPSDPLGGCNGGSFSAAGNSCGVREGYQGYVQGYGQQPSELFESQRIMLDPHNPSAYANGNYKDVLAAGMSGNRTMGSDQISDQIGEFATGSYMDMNGEMKQPIIYDRYMYANRQSRLRAQGDPVRGDLPIVPASGNWFTPNVHPNVDLQAGAINVLAGVNNETGHQLANLIYNTSGGADTTIGGVDMSRLNVANQIFGATSAARGDVIMTSFP